MMPQAKKRKSDFLNIVFKIFPSVFGEKPKFVDILNILYSPEFPRQDSGLPFYLLSSHIIIQNYKENNKIIQIEQNIKIFS